MLTNHLILCADDDAEDQILFSEAIAMVLPADSLQLEFANNGIEALAKLSAIPIPTITFLDLNMPQKDGLSCLEEIRSESKYDNMPVVILSTGQREEDIFNSFRLGAGSYAIKPMSIQDLARILATCFQRFFSSPPKRNTRKLFTSTGFIVR